MEAHVASYADPIAFKIGDPINLTGKSDNWKGHIWLWAVGPDGRSGWIPDAAVLLSEEPSIASRNYSAIELTCSVGEILTALEETHGWVWCQAADGVKGWVPSEKLSSEDVG
nr:SH3 domain-containing protein [Rhizobium sp. BK602]